MTFDEVVLDYIGWGGTSTVLDTTPRKKLCHIPSVASILGPTDDAATSPAVDTIPSWFDPANYTSYASYPSPAPNDNDLVSLVLGGVAWNGPYWRYLNRFRQIGINPRIYYAGPTDPILLFDPDNPQYACVVWPAPAS